MQGAQQQIKNLSGDLQTAQREAVTSNKRIEVEKFKSRLKEQELGTKSKNQATSDKLTNAVKLESEKLRLRGQTQEAFQKLRKKGETNE